MKFETAPGCAASRWGACGLPGLLLGASLLLAPAAHAEDPPAPSAQPGASAAPTRPASRGSGGAAPAGQATGRAGAGATRPASSGAAPSGAAPSGAASAGGAAGTSSGSGATETVALEIVAKAPKPIPPVELDMLQLRLMLSDLKASFADEIDRALFREPF